MLRSRNSHSRLARSYPDVENERGEEGGREGEEGEREGERERGRERGREKEWEKREGGREGERVGGREKEWEGEAVNGFQSVKLFITTNDISSNRFQ